MSLIYYLLEANLYLAAFYLLYVLLLRSETHYQLNRAYLLITSLLAFCIPLIQLGILRPESTALVNISIPVGQAMAVIPEVAQTPVWTLADYTLTLYALVSLALIIHLAIKIYKLIALSKKGTANIIDGFKIIELPGENVAFSFFGYLFINEQLSASQTILHHEQVHIRQKHSWDIIYLEVLKIINWFNPFIYLLQKSIKEVHEFIADEQVATLESDANAYADFLISNAYGLSQNQLTNSFFNKNLLKRRIIMLYQKKSGKAATLKYLLALPLLCAMLCTSTLAISKNYGWFDLAPKSTFKAAPIEIKRANTALPAKTAVENTVDMNAEHPDKSTNAVASAANKVKPAVTASTLTTDDHTPQAADSVYNKPDVNPDYPGGIAAYSDFLRANIKYPKAAHDNNISGRVFLSFIVEKDGSLSNLKVLRAPGNDLSEEAIRVFNLMPKWTPGTQNGKPVRVQYVAPVNFALNDVKTPADTTHATGNKAVYSAVEISPQFPGGTSEFGKFLSQNIKYPKGAKDANVSGRVYISFVVETDGSLTDMKIMRDPGAGLGAEAMRVLQMSPKWTPGIQNGKPVRVQYTVPVNFSLAK